LDFRRHGHEKDSFLRKDEIKKALSLLKERAFEPTTTNN
jgi:hypothetical protein